MLQNMSLVLLPLCVRKNLLKLLTSLDAPVYTFTLIYTQKHESHLICLGSTSGMEGSVCLAVQSTITLMHLQMHREAGEGLFG